MCTQWVFNNIQCVFIHLIYAVNRAASKQARNKVYLWFTVRKYANFNIHCTNYNHKWKRVSCIIHRNYRFLICICVDFFYVYKSLSFSLKSVANFNETTHFQWHFPFQFTNSCAIIALNWIKFEIKTDFVFWILIIVFTTLSTILVRMN